MKVIVGLGNPGKEYENTRHNVGFTVLDKIADFSNDIDLTEKKEYKFKTFILKGEKIILFYPLKFMNASGEALLSFLNYFKIDVDDLLVVHDDMDLFPGKIKLKNKGKSAGHKGVQNIIDHLKTENFKRVKVGIGKPIGNNIDFVLGKPKGEEKKAFDQGIENAVNAIVDYLNFDFDHAMNKFNS